MCSCFSKQHCFLISCYDPTGDSPALSPLQSLEAATHFLLRLIDQKHLFPYGILKPLHSLCIMPVLYRFQAPTMHHSTVAHYRPPVLLSSYFPHLMVFNSHCCLINLQLCKYQQQPIRNVKYSSPWWTNAQGRRTKIKKWEACVLLKRKTWLTKGSGEPVSCIYLNFSSSKTGSFIVTLA